MKKSDDQDQDEAWFSCWDCHCNLGMCDRDNPPQSCEYCGSHAVVFTVPPDSQWERVHPGRGTLKIR